MAFQASTGKRVDPRFSIGGENIPVAKEVSFKFLGMPVRVYRNNHTARVSIQENLQRMLNVIDATEHL